MWEVTPLAPFVPPRNIDSGLIDVELSVCVLSMAGSVLLGSLMGRVKEARSALRAAWASLDGAAKWTTALLVVMVLGGVALRIVGLGFPNRFTFDEELFARNAHNYLLGLRDANDHPPLGKLFMSVGMLLFGFNSLGWRFASLCFGLQSVVVAYFLGRAAYGDRRAGLFAAAFLAADGFFVSYSRAGLLDGMLACLVLWSILCAFTARTARGVALSAVLVGLAASVKWSGAMAVIPAAATVFFLRRAPLVSLFGFLLVPVVHVALWSLGLYLTGQANDLPAIATLMSRLYRHHLDVGDRFNELASPWYAWLYLRHPIMVKVSNHGWHAHYASSVSNPLLHMLASLGAIGIPLTAAFAAILERVKKKPAQRLEGWDSKTRTAMLLFSLGWFALFAIWMVARGRYIFHYHYLPSYGFGLLIVAGALTRMERKHARFVLACVLASFALSAYFAPVWAEFPLSEQAANLRLVFKPWRP